MNQIILVLKSASNSRTDLLWFFITALLLSVLELLSVAAIPAFITVVFSPDTAIKYLKTYLPVLDFSQLTHFSFVLQIGFLLSIFLILKGISAFLISVYQARKLGGFQTNLSSILLKQYLSWPYERYLAVNPAELIRNTVSIPVNMVTGVISSVAVIFTEFFLVAFIAVALLYVNPVVTLATISLLGVTVFCTYQLLKNKLSNFGARANQAAAKTMQWINQSLGGAKEIKILGCESYFHQHYLKHFSDFSRTTLISNCISQAPRHFLEVIAVLGMLGLTLALMVSGSSEKLLPTIALFGAVSLRLIPSANRIWNGIANIRANLNSVEIFQKDTADSTEIESSSDSEKWSFSENLVVKDVSYRYAGSEQFALNSISMEVARNSTVGIAGKSGAGKSTLLDILLGLHKATQGDISIDGASISDNLKGWRSHIGYVPQQIFILDDSVRRNVALGLQDENIDESKLRLALQKACLTDFIDTLPNGLDTDLGDRGARLSGGQRQRIGIARALYRNSQVLFLDEPTSALDKETEQSILETLQNLHGTITIVIIAHHSNMLRQCDKVYVLDEGKVVANGKLDSLEGLDFHYK